MDLLATDQRCRPETCDVGVTVILDTSAIIAVVLTEQDAEALSRRMREADFVGVGAPTLVECGAVLAGRKDHPWRELLDGFLSRFDVEVLPFSTAHWRVAVHAYHQYGKGSGQSAQLNFGDCLTYATARFAGQPLLHLGNDFNRTDLVVVQL